MERHVSLVGRDNLAYDRLGSEGFVTARVGAGTFVSGQVVPLGEGVSTVTSRAMRSAPPRIWNSTPRPA